MLTLTLNPNPNPNPTTNLRSTFPGLQCSSNGMHAHLFYLQRYLAVGPTDIGVLLSMGPQYKQFATSPLASALTTNRLIVNND